MFDVTIAGDINLDFILYGLQEEIPVERESLASDFRLTLGGSGSITAHNLASLGCKVGSGGKDRSRRTRGDLPGSPARRRCGHQPLYSLQHRRCNRCDHLLPHGRTRPHSHLSRHHRRDERPGHGRRISRPLPALPYLVVLPAEKPAEGPAGAVAPDLRARGLTVSMDSNYDPGRSLG